MTAKIRIEDKLTPEDNAMVQALYSRSAESVDVHLKKVEANGSGKFMEKFYVGFNHKSIADCGSTTLYFEGISMLAAKAIEDWPLYSGQETSSRYVDMARQPIVDPIGSLESKVLLERWMTFYRSKQEPVAAHVRTQYPCGADENKTHYDNAVKARTFDILRGFLPAGIHTQCSWHTNLRQASDHLALLVHHPVSEIREIAIRTRAALHSAYPTSGFERTAAGLSAIPADAAQDVWAERCAAFTYFNEPIEDGHYSSSINRADLNPWLDLAEQRPRGGVLPHIMSEIGQCAFEFYLDFGSFRDLQRHRNGVCRMPLLTTEHGFERWYLDQLPPDLCEEARALIDSQIEAIRQLDGDDVEKQNYVALGFRVPCRVTYGLPATVYVMELRSARTVHPTLRHVGLEHMVKPFRSEFPEVRLHVDESPNDWDIRRGRQTITERPL